MNRAYWDGVAADYEREVLSVFDRDVTGAVRSRIEAAVERIGAEGRAADLGCGVGKFTPYLAGLFAHVHACDHSRAALARTQACCAQLDNVAFSCFDLTHEPAPFPPVDFVLCVNVLLMPSMDERRRAWSAVLNQLKRDGRLVLVVPSLESIQFGYFCAVEDALSAGHTCDESIALGLPDDERLSDLQQGVHSLEGVPTKAYLREEVEHMLAIHECVDIEVTKLVYAASAPSTWDWLVTARRR